MKRRCACGKKLALGRRIRIIFFGFAWLMMAPSLRAAEADPSALVQALQNPEQSRRAFEDLQRLGERALPALVAGLNSTNQDVRHHLVSLLGESRSEKAVPPLVQLAQSQDRRDLANALDALEKIGGPAAVEAIIAGFPTLHPTSQQKACRALGAIGDNRAIEPLARMLASKETEQMRSSGEHIFVVRARQAAAEALGKFRDPRSRVALLEAVEQDPDWDVYHSARKALYFMDAYRAAEEYQELSTTVTLAVAKEPEPAGGAEAYIRDWRKANPDGPGAAMRAWSGPMLENFASQTDIKRARDAVAHQAQWGNSDPRAGGVTDLLMEYLCNRKFVTGPENAKALLLRIGKPALPALRNGAKRGDLSLARNCRELIAQIEASR